MTNKVQRLSQVETAADAGTVQSRKTQENRKSIYRRILQPQRREHTNVCAAVTTCLAQKQSTILEQVGQVSGHRSMKKERKTWDDDIKCGGQGTLCCL